MRRHVISLLLLPGLLMVPSVTGCHDHGGNTPAGHHLRPHVHLTAPFAARTQNHTHHWHAHRGHGGHHHHHECAPDPACPAALSSDNPRDHDIGIVVVPEMTFTVERAPVGVNLAAFGWWAGDVPTVGWTTGSPPPVAFRTHPPPPVGSVRLRYLRHLALLL